MGVVTDDAISQLEQIRIVFVLCLCLCYCQTWNSRGIKPLRSFINTVAIFNKHIIIIASFVIPVKLRKKIIIIKGGTCSMVWCTLC